MSKRLKIAISAIAIAMVLIGGVVLFMFIPRAGASIEEIWSGTASYNDDTVITLNKVAGEEFRILQLTDIQFSDVFTSKKKTKSTIARLVAETMPNLIVLTGDNVAGMTTHFNIHSLIDIMDEFKIPWAPVFGNHDRELNANLYYQAKQYSKSKYCLFKQGPSNIQGVGNYVINVKENSKHVYSLFMMDSNARREYDIDGKKIEDYDYIYENQIAWYADNVNGIANVAGAVVPSMAFFHIALPEFKTAYDLAVANDPQSTLITGSRREPECPPPVNTGFFDKMLALGSTTHVMVGHDHFNDYVVKYKDIVLGYGVKTGNHSYYDKLINGGTLLTIGADGVGIRNVIYPLN